MKKIKLWKHVSQNHSIDIILMHSNQKIKINTMFKMTIFTDVMTKVDKRDMI